MSPRAKARVPPAERARRLSLWPNQNRLIGQGATFAYVHLGGRAYERTEKRSEWGRHARYALNFVLEGTARFHRSTGGACTLGPGSIYQHFPGGSARVEPNFAAGFREFYVVVDPATFAGLHRLHIFPRSEVLHPAFEPALDALERFAQHCQLAPEGPRRRSILFELIALLQVLLDYPPVPATGASPLDEAVRRAAALLASDLAARLDGPALARRVGVSYSTLRRAFRQTYGIPPAGYRVRRRIEAATQLLAQQQVQEVAAALGYPDPFTFSAQFKKVVGVSPAKFRAGLRT